MVFRAWKPGDRLGPEPLGQLPASPGIGQVERKDVRLLPGRRGFEPLPGSSSNTTTERGLVMPTNINDKLISWASEIDELTVAQAQKTSRLPIIAGHVALMPDAHVGKGATIGSGGQVRRAHEQHGRPELGLDASEESERRGASPRLERLQRRAGDATGGRTERDLTLN